MVSYKVLFLDDEKPPKEPEVTEENNENPPVENKNHEKPKDDDKVKFVKPDDAPFATVDKSYFKDVLFIGDSRTVGLFEYGQIEGANFFANTGMNVYNVREKTVSVSNLGNVTLDKLLSSKQYGKIYLMLGINELGPMAELYKLLDLLCVSIASDIVPITDENRILAYYGLQQLNEQPSLGLATIIKSSGIDKEKKEITINDIVFRIGPRINAAGRVESGRKAVELLTADEPALAREIASDINTFNDQRKKLDHHITEEAIRHISESETERTKKTTVLFNPDWHKGVIGIVASRLTESFYRPTIILTESNGWVTGSARSVEGFDLYYAISQCSDLLENYGGHKYAAGLTLKPGNLEPFKRKFEQIVRETITEEMLTPQINIDARITLSDITPELYAMLQKFAPFGPNNTMPVFVTENVADYLKTRQVGRNNEHLKLTVVDRSRDCKDRSGIGFGMGALFDKVTGQCFDLCYTLQENEFMGRNDIQMIVKDIHFKE